MLTISNRATYITKKGKKGKKKIYVCRYSEFHATIFSLLTDD